MKEIRTFNCEMRADKENRTVSGIAAVFGERTELWPGMWEEIDKEAFSDVLDDDVRALFNHNPEKILARTKSGTLKIGVDELGLVYEFSSPETTTGNDLLVSIERGDISQSSFAFSVKSVEWIKMDDGNDLRIIKKLSKLYDVSPVTYPAYEGTSVTKRSKEDYEQEKKETTQPTPPSPYDDLSDVRLKKAKLNFKLINNRRN